MKHRASGSPDAGSVNPAFERSAVAAGVRTTAAALVPMIVGRAVGQPALGSMVAIGALYVSLTDVGGFFRSRALTMAVATAGAVVAALIGTLAGGTLWLALAVAFLVAFAGGLVGIYGTAGNKISFCILATFVITLGLSGGAAVALERAVAVLAGGLWALLLSLWLWPTRPYQPAREAVAAYYRALRAFLARVPREGDDTGGINPRATAANAPERAAVLEAAKKVRDALLAVRASAHGASPEGERLMLLALRADSLFDAAVAVAESLAVAARQPHYVEVRPLVEQAVRHSSAVAGWVAEAIAREGAAVTSPLTFGRSWITPRREAAPLDLTELDRTVACLSELVTRLRKAAGDLEASYPVFLALRNLVRALERLAQTAHGAVDALQQPHPERQEGERPGAGQPVEPGEAGRALHALRENLTFDSLIFRHALRLSIAVAAAVAIAMALRLPRGYWLMLTVLVILKPDFGGTRERAVQRVGGTVLGGIAAALLAAMVRSEMLIYALMVPLGILAFSQLPRNYGLFVTLLTPFVVLMIDLGDPGDWQVAATRVLNTVIGGALALLAGYLLWPRSERERLPDQLARTIAANREYFHQVLSAYLGPGGDAAALQEAREQAQVENANAGAALQRLLSEPPRQRAAVEPLYELAAANHSFFDGVTTLAAYLPAFSGRHTLPGLRWLAEQIERLLAGIAEAVRSGRRPEPLPPLEKSVQVVQAATRKLMAARVAELAAQPDDSPTRQAVLDLTPVSTGLRRLAQDAAGMYRAQLRASGEE